MDPYTWTHHVVADQQELTVWADMPSLYESLAQQKIPVSYVTFD